MQAAPLQLLKRNQSLSEDMKKSLQEIQDFYENLGYSGDKLRKILLKDKDYTQILKEREQKLTKKIKIKKLEKRKYVMSTDVDYEILEKIKFLERRNLKKEDAVFVKFMRSQLERDWRKPLLKMLDKLLKKYS